MSLFISPETMAVLFELGVPLDKAMELLRCIERDPAKRYQDADALAQALAELRA